MATIRVYELAKEMGMNSKELQEKLQALGLPIKNHMSTIPKKEVNRIKAMVLNYMGDPAAKPIPTPEAKKEKPALSGLRETKSKEEVKEKVEQPKKDIKEAAVQAKSTSEAHDRHKGLQAGEAAKKSQPISKQQDVKKAQGDKKTTMKDQGTAQLQKTQQPKKQKPNQKAQVQKPQKGAVKQTVIGKENADKISHLVKTHDDDNFFLSKLESTLGDTTYERGGKTKTPNRKSGRFEEGRSSKIKPKGKQRPQKPIQKEPAPVIVKHIILDGPTTVVELAHLMNRKAADLIKKLFDLGVMATINQVLDMDTIILLGQEFGTTIEPRITKEEMLSQVTDEPDDPSLLQERPPVVTIMGHVDHGKTSLLDAIRKANVQASEAGGITQHIGAYQVVVNDKKITFLDTPGHEAFTAMRARGAQVTDIAVLVVAADDGVMPQTVEAVNHAKAANVPIIVAINKIDKEGANPDRIKQELTEHGLVPEEWGGETIFVEVSAKTHKNLEELLEMILLVAEMQDLKANPERKAKGVVIEAKLDKGRGPVATVLVQNGTLNTGDYVIAGMTQGRVRAMNDERGRTVKKATPSTPVEIIGLSEVPQAGDIFQVVEDERLAKQIVSERSAVKREEAIHSKTRISLEDLFQQIKTGEVKDLNIIIKADVQGSIEALKGSLEKLSNDEVRVNIIHHGVGGITETDVDFAAASNAIIIGFNVRPDVNARKKAEHQQVDIKLYRVIYNAIEDVKSALSGLLKPELKEVVVGHAEVRQVIKVPKVGSVAGAYVTEGKIFRNSQCRITRDGIIIYEGSIGSLRRFKDDVKEVAAGYECGIGFENFNDIQVGDQIEAYKMEEIKRQL